MSRNGELWFQAGGGIVAKSDEEYELQEVNNKLGVTFDYGDYVNNGQADSTVLGQIATDLVADDVDVIIPIATSRRQGKSL